MVVLTSSGRKARPTLLTLYHGGLILPACLQRMTIFLLSSCAMHTTRILITCDHLNISHALMAFGTCGIVLPSLLASPCGFKSYVNAMIAPVLATWVLLRHFSMLQSGFGGHT
jgi:hypothetical protein